MSEGVFTTLCLWPASEGAQDAYGVLKVVYEHWRIIWRASYAGSFRRNGGVSILSIYML